MNWHRSKEKHTTCDLEEQTEKTKILSQTNAKLAKKPKTRRAKEPKLKQRTLQNFIRQKEHQDNGKENDEDNPECTAVAFIDAMKKVNSSKNVAWLYCIICEEWYYATALGLADCTEKKIEETICLP